jgi:hypothetical protein
MGWKWIAKSRIRIPVTAPKEVKGACFSNSLVISFNDSCTLILKTFTYSLICIFYRKPPDFFDNNKILLTIK